MLRIVSKRTKCRVLHRLQKQFRAYLPPSPPFNFRENMSLNCRIGLRSEMKHPCLPRAPSALDSDISGAWHTSVAPRETEAKRTCRQWRHLYAARRDSARPAFASQQMSSNRSWPHWFSDRIRSCRNTRRGRSGPKARCRQCEVPHVPSLRLPDRYNGAICE